MVRFHLIKIFIYTLTITVFIIISGKWGYLELKSDLKLVYALYCGTQCKRVHIFIVQFAIFCVFQEVNGS